jgi:hypothetical protein
MKPKKIGIRTGLAPQQQGCDPPEIRVYAVEAKERDLTGELPAGDLFCHGQTIRSVLDCG